MDLQIGAALVSEAAEVAEGRDASRLRRAAEAMKDGSPDGIREALAADFAALMLAWAPRPFVTRYERDLLITVDRVRARTGAWYETFPRSTSPEAGRHGTLRDLILRLPYIAEMGFDVLYLPPIHPIGLAYRKGPNNNVQAAEGDFGSPWAIGARPSVSAFRNSESGPWRATFFRPPASCREPNRR
jgi:starch synthase (maltosyl-transferring)